MYKEGQEYQEEVSFTQEQVQAFADFSNDTNPSHLDAEYAATTQFKKPIMHGMIGASVFSKIYAMDFPGKAPVFLTHNVSFKRPMYVDTLYEVKVVITHIDQNRHIATFAGTISDKETGKTCMVVESKLMQKELF